MYTGRKTSVIKIAEFEEMAIEENDYRTGLICESC